MTVEVTGRLPTSDAGLGTVTKLPSQSPFISRAPVLSDILRRAPGVNMRVNSRGETLASVRGAGERQLALFLDGAPLNVPWDNRFDLAQIPLGGFSGMTFLRGPSSGRYGANAAGSVVVLQTDWIGGTSVNVSSGSANDRSFGLRHGGREGRLRWQLSGSLNTRDGYPVPDKQAAFTLDGKTLTNTDRDQLAFNGRLAYQLPAGEAFTSLLLSGADFGIAPEQGGAVRDDVRFWRYPKADHLFAVAGIKNVPIQMGIFSASVWHQSFDQTIDDYSDSTYSTVSERQLDNNRSFGASANITRQTSNGMVSLGVRALNARHEQTNVEASQTNAQLGGVGGRADVFSQTSLAVMAQYSGQLTDKMATYASVSYDIMRPHQTAGRPSSGQFSGLGASLGMSIDIDPDWQMQIIASRQVRLPTLRELFGETLGRFVLNPELQPETAWLFETGVRYSRELSHFTITPFAVLTDNTLDQFRFAVDGEPKRQRINLRGSRTYGVESEWKIQLHDRIAFSGSVVWSRSRRLPEVVDNSARRLYLSNRPNWLAQAVLDYQLGTRTTFGLEVVHRGAAKSLQANGQFVTLKSASTFNFAVSHMFFPARDEQGLQLTVSAENLTDVFVEPQLGLPDPGRRVTIGVQYSF